jgi:[protein-PII] uridylyltransferase
MPSTSPSKHISQFKQQLGEKIHQLSVPQFTTKLVNYIDNLIVSLYQKHQLNRYAIGILAVGSYGRRELQLYSDVDLVILSSKNLSETGKQKAGLFIQDCWDLGLTISHQITTVKQLAELAANDLSVISSLLDMRMLAGKGDLMDSLAFQTHPSQMWTSETFFQAKLSEQKKRYEKYGETAYNLEPNVKYGPGGLRDLQIILSIGKRHFGIKKLADGINCGFFNDKEYEELVQCQHFLWQIRNSLHFLAGKAEERLLFDYQIKLSRLFGFQDNNANLAIEQLMKTYFNVIKRTRELNEMLLQLFNETIVFHQKQKIKPIDDCLQVSNQHIEICKPHIFHQHPIVLLRLFYTMAKNPSIRGIRANTIRLIRQNLYLINRRFKNMSEAKKLFLALFQQDNSPYETLHQMNRYGVLGRYLESFSHVTGQMQYDLFHVYTVDQHTLFVIRNIGRFLDPAYEGKFNLAYRLMSDLPNKDILYLAALFHDIGKGRGGDHSEIGAKEASDFGISHSLENDKIDLLVWLVENHLLMSQTTQRSDIYDPQIIHAFCQHLPKPDYLDYLYLLTVADICATNPALWTAWKDSLLKELYRSAKQVMHDERALINESVIIEERQQQSLSQLLAMGYQKSAILTLWQSIKTKYFLHESPEIITRHTGSILDCERYPLVMIMPHHSQGGTEVFTYLPHREDRFVIISTVLNNLHCTIQEAFISTGKNQFDLDTFVILDEKNREITSKEKTDKIKHSLTYYLKSKERLPSIIKRRQTRTQAHFNVEPSLEFSLHPKQNQTLLFLVTGDRPGLLAAISHVFYQQHIQLHHAKIATAGERVEDTFHISNADGKPLSNEEKLALQAALNKVI